MHQVLSALWKTVVLISYSSKYIDNLDDVPCSKTTVRNMSHTPDLISLHYHAVCFYGSPPFLILRFQLPVDLLLFIGTGCGACRERESGLAQQLTSGE